MDDSCGNGTAHINGAYDAEEGGEDETYHHQEKSFESMKVVHVKTLLWIGAITALCVSLGVGIGVGFAIGKNSAPASVNEPVRGSEAPTTTSQHTTEPQATEPQASNPPAATSNAPEPLPDHWLDLPCMQETKCPAGVSKPPTILVSLDGFRDDFMDRGLTPNLDKLSSCGVTTPYMTPSFPTLTFPNHYTQVTGLYPESHGIVGNNMYDPVLGQSFSLSSKNKFNSEWWGGEPIWNTAKNAGLRTATYFWVGSDIEIQKMRPDYWFLYAGDAEYLSRADVLVALLDQPEGLRPDFLTLYYDEPDHTGHDPGPNTPEQNGVIKHMDDVVGYLMDGLMRIGLHECINVMVMADHGMANRSCDQLYVLEEYIKEDDYYIRSTAGTMLRLDPKSSANISEPEDVVDELKCRHPVAIPYVKTDIPKRWHYINNIRIEDILITVPAGWTASAGETDWCDGGTHGYDNLDASMRALFIAHGPAFKSGVTVEPFQNIELYELMCEILDITPAPNNGTRGSLHHLLKSPKPLPTPAPTNTSTTVSCDYPATDLAYQQRLDADETECSCEAFTSSKIKEFDARLDSVSNNVDVHAPFGLPIVQSNDEICVLLQEKYITGYSHRIGAPLYATYTINRGQINNLKDDINNCPARPDVRLTADTPAHNCVFLEMDDDEELTNLTTGYLHPPIIGQSDEEAMDSLITSNAIPQFKGFKRDMWDGFLFQHINIWANDANGVNVVTGPIYDYDSDGFRDRHNVRENERLENSTIIPSHYFMVLSRCPGEGVISPSCTDVQTTAFILPNMDGIYSCQTSEDYVEHHRASIGDVEKLTGLSLFPDINMDEYQRISLRLKIHQRGELWKDWPFV